MQDWKNEPNKTGGNDFAFPPLLLGPSLSCSAFLAFRRVCAFRACLVGWRFVENCFSVDSKTSACLRRRSERLAASAAVWNDSKSTTEITTCAKDRLSETRYTASMSVSFRSDAMLVLVFTEHFSSVFQKYPTLIQGFDARLANRPSVLSARVPENQKN